MDRGIRISARLLSSRPPARGEGLRLGIYQGEGPAGTPDAVAANMARLEDAVAMAAAYSCQLCVFPENYVTGYTLSREQVVRLAEPADGPSVARAAKVAARHEVAIALPYPEAGADGRYYDSITVIGPDGQILTTYRKTHLYGAAERRNFAFGRELPPVIGINGIRVGVLNCYECEMPPLYQYLAEAGAQVVIGPTAADGHFQLADGTASTVPYQDATRHIIRAMASVWRLFVAYANRRGWETSDGNWWQYQGNSGIWAPNGDTVTAATAEDRAADTLLVADCDPSRYPPFSPEGDHMADNRLELIKRLRDPASDPLSLNEPGGN